MHINVGGKQTYLYTNNKDIDATKKTVLFIHGA